MPSLSILIPLYPSLCILLSSLLIAYLHRRRIRHALARLVRKTKTRRQGHYARLHDTIDGDAEPGVECAIDLESLAEENENENTDSEAETPPRQDRALKLPPPNTTPSSPLSAYFDAHTKLILPHLLSPTAPPTPGWERRLRHRLDEGRGLGAWTDRMVERMARWLFTFSTEPEPCSLSI